jgi:hypothetical protein
MHPHQSGIELKKNLIVHLVKFRDVISVNDQTEKVPEDKLKLPFSSSIYSLRRNRSLPDLSIYESTSNEKSNNQELPVPRKKTHRRKATIGSIEKDGIISTGLKDSSKLAQTISSPYKDLSIETLKPTKRNRSNYSAAEKTTSTDDLSVSETRDRSSDLSSSNEKRSGKSVDDIADGALSDSEVDKHRRGSDAVIFDHKRFIYTV